MYDPDQVEWYSRTRGATDIGPSISLNKAGRVVLNQDTLGMFDVTPEAFMVGIIQGRSQKITLVLQAANKGDVGALALTPQGRTKFSLNTSRFFKERGLERLFGEVGEKPKYDKEHNALLTSL